MRIAEHELKKRMTMHCIINHCPPPQKFTLFVASSTSALN